MSSHLYCILFVINTLGRRVILFIYFIWYLYLSSSPDLHPTFVSKVIDSGKTVIDVSGKIVSQYCTFPLFAIETTEWDHLLICAHLEFSLIIRLPLKGEIDVPNN